MRTDSFKEKSGIDLEDDFIMHVRDDSCCHRAGTASDPPSGNNLAAELADAFIDSTINGDVDGIHGFLIGLGNDDEAAVLGF